MAFVPSFSALWCVFSTALWKTRIKDGSTVTQQITPNTTPFAMTIPMSRPNVKVMKHMARKPAMVVRDEPATDTIVADMAYAMASLGSGCSCSSS